MFIANSVFLVMVRTSAVLLSPGDSSNTVVYLFKVSSLVAMVLPTLLIEPQLRLLIWFCWISVQNQNIFFVSAIIVNIVLSYRMIQVLVFILFTLLLGYFVVGLNLSIRFCQFVLAFNCSYHDRLIPVISTCIHFEYIYLKRSETMNCK